VSESKLNEKMWRCDCGAEALGVSFYDWPGEKAEWFIEVYKMGGVGHWRWRVQKALAMLLGREVYIEAVALDKDKTQELIEFLNANIASVTE